MAKPVPHLLRDLVEPLAANVYFAPEAINGYAELGLAYPQGYFSSRGACLGQVDGYVIASAFGVFYPPMVKGMVDEAWSKTDAPTILDARRRGATAALERQLGEKPDGLDRATELLKRAGEAGTVAGHPLYAGLTTLDWPGDPMGNLWRAADIVREHRGDSHTAAWTSAGLTAIEVLLLTEAWWGMPIHTYSRTRAWPDDEVEATIASLQERGLISADQQLTDAGTQLRRDIEAATDKAEFGIVAALGNDADELFTIIEPWAKAIVESGGYPTDPSQLVRK
ncbi:MAG: hypothetical protein JOZ37_01640 [Actinobacteria bacterium]|nr:hypothetical protein [Actinomycetota bacterium]MBV9936237.1 hypothetical protein [Actinomycetota bacterium]